MNDADLYVLIVLAIAGIAVNLYPVIYLFRQWWSTPAGRAVMVKAWGNVILVNMALAYAVFGDYPFRTQVRHVGLTVFAIGAWYLLIVLLRTPRTPRDSEE